MILCALVVAMRPGSLRFNPKRSEVKPLITLGHLSDLHATDPSRASLAALSSKRFFGWLSWNLRRSRLYKREIATALLDDLKREAPDHVAVTGDLINISLPAEFKAAAGILRALGTPDWVTLVPGNHDAYVDMPFERAWAHWSSYLESDPAEIEDVSDSARTSHYPNAFSFPGRLPSVRIRGDLALVGVCTALPTKPFIAGGKVGSGQLEQLESTLETLRARDLCRVVLIHHPVVDGHVAKRRRLSDSGALREVLERAGAELVIHGHNHRSEFKSLVGRDGEIPVVGVRSGSYGGPNPKKTAQYHIYQLERAKPDTGLRFQVSLRVREWDARARTFVEVGEPRALPLRKG